MYKNAEVINYDLGGLVTIEINDSYVVTHKTKSEMPETLTHMLLYQITIYF